MEHKLTGIESIVSFTNSQGHKGKGTLIHITRTTAVFEIYNPYSIVQLSEVLPSLNVLRGQRTIYKGRAVVGHILTTGLMVIISATLVDTWNDMSGLKPGGSLQAETDRFIKDWESGQKLNPDYQLVVGHLRNFLNELSHWLEAAEVEIIDKNEIDDAKNIVEDFYREVEKPIGPKLGELFLQFEEAAKDVELDEITAHKAFARRELHPLTLCSPFVHRTYSKPLGYAGDYEMVNMMLRTSTAKPTTTYAKIVDAFHIEAASPESHRNRIVMLEDRLKQEAERVIQEEERIFTVLNIGCGPAVELRRFIRDNPLSKQSSFQLMDFNDETLKHVKGRLKDAVDESGNKPVLKITHKSIDDLLREAHQKDDTFGHSFDFVYCAGLFDYFSDHICKRLVSMFYTWLRPGGLLSVTNVHSSNPNRNHMEHLLEWHLVYRNERDMENLVPRDTHYRVVTDEMGVAVFLDIRDQS